MEKGVGEFGESLIFIFGRVMWNPSVAGGRLVVVDLLKLNNFTKSN